LYSGPDCLAPNLLVFKVINEQADWSGCGRFPNKDCKVSKSLHMTVTPT
jgi:hypothetical protein